MSATWLITVFNFQNILIAVVVSGLSVRLLYLSVQHILIVPRDLRYYILSSKIVQ